MMYQFMTLDDGTGIAHSDMYANGRVKVYIEKPDAEYCFRHATCWLPDYKWEDIYHFSDEDIKRFQEVIESTANLILEFSQEGGSDCCLKQEQKEGNFMPLLKERIYTSEDYWNLPDGERAELIGGNLIAMAPPNRIHQLLVMEIAGTIRDHIRAHAGNCQVYPAPFAVNLNADDKTWVEPDISVICDKHKLTERGCSGAPDLIIEIVSPGSRKTDYNRKNALYSDAGVREYWIVDPVKSCTTVYYFEKDAAPTIIPFSAPVAVGIYEGFSITISELIGAAPNSDGNP